MRNILLSFFILLIHFNVTAQNGLNFQGVARNPSGVILASQKITLKFYILSDLNNGTVEFAETRLVNTNAQGIFSIIIGDTGAINSVGSFSNIAWKLGNKFLKVEMDPNGGNAFVDMGTTQLQNVPYAYYAKGVNASNIDGVLPISAGGSGVTSLAQLKNNLLLNFVNNTADLEKPISLTTQNALDLKANISDLDLKASLDAPVFTGVVSGITKSMVGLDKVNNTADIDKPISILVQSALDTKVESSTFSSSLNLKEDITNKSITTDLGGLVPSDVLYPSQKAVKSYVDAQVASGGVADGGITNVKIANNAGIPFSKLNITKSDITNLGIPSTTDLTSYNAGNGLALTGTTFSVASNVLTSNYTGVVNINGSSFAIDNNTVFVSGINHNVGIGTNTPISKLEVNGAATNATAHNANSSTLIDFSLSNLAYTSASAGFFTLNNIKDGGTYTLAVQGNTSGTSSFESNGFTFYSTNNGATSSNKQTLYTFIVMGSKVYYFMTTGF